MSLHGIGIDGRCLCCGTQVESTNAVCPRCTRSNPANLPCYCKHGAPIMAHCTGCCAEKMDALREIALETARRVAHEASAEVISDDQAEDIAREVAREKGVTL